MTGRTVTKEALRAMAEMSGMELSDEQLDELLPQVQRAVGSIGGLDVLDLAAAEPAVVFKADQPPQ